MSEFRTHFPDPFARVIEQVQGDIVPETGSYGPGLRLYSHCRYLLPLASLSSYQATVGYESAYNSRSLKSTSPSFLRTDAAIALSLTPALRDRHTAALPGASAQSITPNGS